MPAKAIVTGASGGLGLEFATLLAQAGYDVVLVARSIGKLQSLAQTLRERFGVDAQTVVLDLAQPSAAKALFAKVPACDVLVNNAGFANNGPFAGVPEADISEEVQLDVVTLTDLCRLYVTGMIERSDGKILNVASTAGFLPGPDMAVYYASKAYVISFSEALAEELKHTGVSVTVLCPGATRTGFQDRARLNETPLFRAPLADAQNVAKTGIEAMMRGKRLVVHGIGNKLVAFCVKFAPRRVLTSISGRLVRRRED